MTATAETHSEVVTATLETVDGRPIQVRLAVSIRPPSGPDIVLSQLICNVAVLAAMEEVVAETRARIAHREATV
jgi:hypothetical protein